MQFLTLLAGAVCARVCQMLTDCSGDPRPTHPHLCPCICHTGLVQDLQSIRAEMDPALFNFLKANPSEVLFGFKVMPKQQVCGLTMACSTADEPPQHYVMINP